MAIKNNELAATLDLGIQGCIKVSGILNAYTVPRLINESKLLFHRGGVQPMTVDLDNVVYSDSAGLTLLTAWLRLAKQCQITLGFKHMPAQMRTIAKVSGLEAVLPWM
jgi:phospholipid transport system transporter-binding protein